MLVIVYAIWIGALVASVLKLASPHRSVVSWLLAALVGSLGGVVGLFAARMVGIDASRPLACHVAEALAAAGLVMVYALVSRAIYGRRLRVRPTRPTIVF